LESFPLQVHVHPPATQAAHGLFEPGADGFCGAAFVLLQTACTGKAGKAAHTIRSLLVQVAGVANDGVRGVAAIRGFVFEAGEVCIERSPVIVKQTYFPNRPLSLPNSFGKRLDVELSKAQLLFNAEAFTKMIREK
jgi:hypothetical protein